MATTFKTLLNNDRVTTRTLLHESIPVTGTIASGTYGDNNIKNYSHGMFQSVYDYPYLSSSANHIFDITCGYSSDYSQSMATQQEKKLNLYDQMAQILVGHDETGSIRKFDRDGDLTGGEKIEQAYFFCFSRLLSKDEVKKGTFTMSFMTGGISANPGGNGGSKLTLGDYNASTNYKINSPAGEYGILYTSSVNIVSGTGVGLLYYQAGIAVISSSIFGSASYAATGSGLTGDQSHYNQWEFGAGGTSVERTSVWPVMTGTTIQNNSDAVRNRLVSIDFNNTTELNSTIYFCRTNHNEFNYSSNPTYVTASKIRVKNVSSDTPVSYITSIGLYSADNELLALAKLSEPLKKDPTTEFTLRVRLDY